MGSDNFIRGGHHLFGALHHALSHAIKIASISIFAWFGLTSILDWTFAGEAWQAIGIYFWSHFWTLTGLPDHVMHWQLGQTRGRATAAALASWSDQHIAGAIFTFFGLGMFSGAAIVLVDIWVIRWMRKAGKTATDARFLRGQALVSAKELSSLTKADRSGASRYQIGGVPIPNRLIMRNFLFLGGMGSGKSQAIQQIMDVARDDSISSVVYDPTGEFLSAFYRAGDIILNPLDSRCAPWSPFAEVQAAHDWIAVARAFLPYRPGGGEGAMWDDAARRLLADLLMIEHAERGKAATLAGVYSRLHLPLPDLCSLLHDHKVPSSAAMSAENPRGSESIRLTLAASESIALLRYWDRPGVFSIRQHTREKRSPWVFVTSSAAAASVIRPWAAVWLDLALLGAMEGRPVQTLQTLFMLDELPSLPRLRALEIATSQGRKFGVAVGVGLQNIAQIEEIYGREQARSLIGGLQNKLILRTEEAQSAQSLSDILGKEEIDDPVLGDNAGVSEKESSGLSISRQRKDRLLVLPSEIICLPDLSGFLKIAGDFPIAKVSIPLIVREPVAEDFVDAGRGLIEHKEPAQKAEEPATEQEATDTDESEPVDLW